MSNAALRSAALATEIMVSPGLARVCARSPPKDGQLPRMPITAGTPPLAPAPACPAEPVPADTEGLPDSPLAAGCVVPPVPAPGAATPAPGNAPVPAVHCGGVPLGA